MNDKEYDIYKRIEKLEKRVEALLIIEKQNADLVTLLKAVDDILGDVYDMVDEDKFNAVWKQVSQALAQVKGDQA